MSGQKQSSYYRGISWGTARHRARRTHLMARKMWRSLLRYIGRARGVSDVPSEFVSLPMPGASVQSGGGGPHQADRTGQLELAIRWKSAGRPNLAGGHRETAGLSAHQRAGPHAYLKDIRERLPTQPGSRIDDLLPRRAAPRAMLISAAVTASRQGELTGRLPRGIRSNRLFRAQSPLNPDFFTAVSHHRVSSCM